MKCADWELNIESEIALVVKICYITHGIIGLICITWNNDFNNDLT